MPLRPSSSRLSSVMLDPTGGQIKFLGRDFRVKQSTPCKTWGFVDMETTNKHAKTQKYTRVLARRSQFFFSRAQMGFLGDSGCVTSSKQAVGSAFPAAYVPNTII